MRPLNLIVNCTSRKKSVIPKPLCARTLMAKTPVKRLEEWVKRRETVQTEEYRASDLYAGDHWYVSKTIPEEATQVGLNVRLWVCSAGYGLVRASDFIKPYSVTFTPSHPDSVMPQVTEYAKHSFFSKWWSGLCYHSVLSGGPQSIRDIAAAEPDAPIIVAASAPYLLAIAHDLLEAKAVLESQELISIFSSALAVKQFKNLKSSFLQTDARFEAIVGGTRSALNARIARIVFRNLSANTLPTTTHLNWVLKKLGTDLPPLRRFDRRKLSNDEVHQFISKERRNDPSICKTRLLRKLRSEGAACEQKRFSEIYTRVLEATDDAT